VVARDDAETPENLQRIKTIKRDAVANGFGSNAPSTKTLPLIIVLIAWHR
jgi:hypothetical protein